MLLSSASCIHSLIILEAASEHCYDVLHFEVNEHTTIQNYSVGFLHQRQGNFFIFALFGLFNFPDLDQFKKSCDVFNIDIFNSICNTSFLSKQ